MKQIIYTSLVSLFSGIFFVLGAMGVVLVADNWKDPSELLEPRKEVVRLPPGVVIAEHRKIDGTPHFTIQGVVENTGKKDWIDVSIWAEILVGNAQVNTCEAEVDGVLSAGTRRAFQIGCHGVAGSGLPDNVSYRLSIPNAYQERAN